jgi:uncharacterized membrane protein
MSNPRSTAAIAGHPIHPMLVPMPIAFFVAAFLCDLAFWYSANALWSTAALWLLGAGLVGGAAAALAGLIDVLGETRIRTLRDAWYHAIGNVVVMLLALFTFYQRYRYGAEAVLPWGFATTAVMSGLLLFTGWKGGELVFRHRVAVTEPSEAARETRTGTTDRMAA